MSQINDKQGIVNSWSLVAYAKMFKQMQVAPCVNKDTGEQFKSCVFTKTDGSFCFVSFSSKLGELTAREISQMRDSLQVVELASGNLKLCKVGENSWETVDLGF